MDSSISRRSAIVNNGSFSELRKIATIRRSKMVLPRSIRSRGRLVRGWTGPGYMAVTFFNSDARLRLSPGITNRARNPEHRPVTSQKYFPKADFKLFAAARKEKFQED